MPAMPLTPAHEALPGTFLFLECGCSGWRGVNPPDGPILMVVEKPCAEHEAKGRPQLRTLEPWELVSPLTKFAHG